MNKTIKYINSLIEINSYLEKDNNFSYSLIKKDNKTYYLHYYKGFINFIFKIAVTRHLFKYSFQVSSYYALYKKNEIPLNLTYDNNIYTLDEGEMDCSDYRLLKRISMFIPTYITKFNNIMENNIICELNFINNVKDDIFYKLLLENKYKLKFKNIYQFSPTNFQIIINEHDYNEIFSKEFKIDGYIGKIKKL